VSPLPPEGENPTRAESAGLCVTLLGRLGDGAATARIAALLADHQLSIREIRSLGDDALTGLELIADLPVGGYTVSEELVTKLRRELLLLGKELKVDLAVQKDDIFRRSRRLVCMDVDSTFVKGEFIDELARLCGCEAQVSAITARAMRGELDFKQALIERVKLLEGLPLAEAQALGNKFELTPGAGDFVKVLKILGFKVGLVSGGFDFFVDKLKSEFALDFAFANELEVRNGALTGRVQGTIVDSDRKAQLLKDMAKVFDIRLEQCVAIGDGANDIVMLQTAGLGIAYNAKPKLQEVADMSLNHNERLDTLLHLMGFDAKSLRGLE
jgi:phosphoserine phosphatase